VCPAVSNGTPGCSAGACGVGGCNASFANCNGLVVDGCEVNLTNDVNNCNGCGNSCSSMCSGQVAATACTGSTCGITACDPSYYNTDGTCGNGCECLSSSASSQCNVPSSLGAAVGIGQSQAYTGNLVPAGREAWFIVTFTGNGNTSYHPHVRFTTNPGSAFQFDIRSDCGGSALACGTEGGTSNGLTDWETSKPAANGYNNVIPPVGNNGTILIRVFRKAGAPVTCASFTLTISN